MIRPSVRTPSTSKIIIRMREIRFFSSFSISNVTGFESSIFSAHNIKYPDKAFEKSGRFFQPKRIRAVAEGLVRFRMSFDEDPVSSCRHRRARKRRDKTPLTTRRGPLSARKLNAVRCVKYDRTVEIRHYLDGTHIDHQIVIAELGAALG